MDTSFGQQGFFKITPFIPSVANINERASRRETWGENLNDGSNQFAVLAWAKSDLLPRCNLNRDTGLLPLLGVTGYQSFAFGYMAPLRAMPCRSIEGTDQGQYGRFDLIDGIRAVYRTIRNIRVV